MEQVRSSFQGVKNVFRFNWHFYVLAAMAIIALGLGITTMESSYKGYLCLALLAVAGAVSVSLLVSAYVYDLSPLYKLNWLTEFDAVRAYRIVNIHAGFDETSILLQQRYQSASLTVLDFYDPAKHTEVSIKRARKAYPAYPGTRETGTTHIDLDDQCADVIFALFAAHEIRDDEERAKFFSELRRTLSGDGRIVVTEHLRDIPNFLAYNIGFFHFHSAKTWDWTFRKAGLEIEKTKKITPFVTTFILRKNGTAS